MNDIDTKAALALCEELETRAADRHSDYTHHTDLRDRVPALAATLRAAVAEVERLRAAFERRDQWARAELHNSLHLADAIRRWAWCPDCIGASCAACDNTGLEQWARAALREAGENEEINRG